MKSIDELNPHHYEVNDNMKKNGDILFERLMEFQDSSNIDFIINSGLRSEGDQVALINEGKTNAVHSKHLSFSAADINDPEGLLAEWVKNNLDAVTRIGLWFEDFSHTKGWVHAQIMPPNSGKIIFIP